MAITTPPFFPYVSPDTDFMAKLDMISFDTIQGQLITLVMSVPEHEAGMNMNDESWRNHIKEKLAVQMAKTILEKNLCDFTTQPDLIAMKRRFYIRCYLTPDDQVRMIRKLNDA